MTAKYPLGLILIELAHQVSTHRMALWVEWVPRLKHEEADALTDSDLWNVTTSNRTDVDLTELIYVILD